MSLHAGIDTNLKSCFLFGHRKLTEFVPLVSKTPIPGQDLQDITKPFHILICYFIHLPSVFTVFPTTKNSSLQGHMLTSPNTCYYNT